MRYARYPVGAGVAGYPPVYSRTYHQMKIPCHSTLPDTSLHRRGLVWPVLAVAGP